MTSREENKKELKKRKIGNKARGREFPSGKFQKMAENKGRKGSSEDEEDEEEEEEEKEEERTEFKFPEQVGISLKLSKEKLKEFPERFLDKLGHVQYMYLEGNKLSRLPVNFFKSLPSLKWLDLRNNELISLPTLGLKDHPSLETILLQGNRIRNLPLELATIPSLKGIQITGNPITNVPYEVIANGFHSIMQHLRKLRAQEEISLPLSDGIVVKPSTSKDNPSESPPLEPTDTELRMWDLDKLSKWRHFIKKKSGNEGKTSGGCTDEKTTQKVVAQQPKAKPLKPVPFRCGVLNRNRQRSASRALRYLRMRKTRLGYTRTPITYATLCEKAMEEAYKARMRETLEKQAKKIQRMRDRDVLRNWRDHARLTREQVKLLDNYQPYPSKDFAEKTPFDVDPEFMNMLNRVDLYRSLRDYESRHKQKKKPRVRITALDLERQMNEIMRKLKELDTNDGEESSSPRTKHGHVCDKINKIMDIQKTLQNLQTLNSSMSGVVPIVKSRSHK